MLKEYDLLDVCEKFAKERGININNKTKSVLEGELVIPRINSFRRRVCYSPNTQAAHIGENKDVHIAYYMAQEIRLEWSKIYGEILLVEDDKQLVCVERDNSKCPAQVEITLEQKSLEQKTKSTLYLKSVKETTVDEIKKVIDTSFAYKKCDKEE